MAAKLLSLLLLCSLCASFVPLSLPKPLTDKQRDSAPFPCQHRNCGCRSAAQCWKKCCCFTNSQKVTWARKNGVTPPKFVIAAAKREAVSGSTEAELCRSHPVAPPVKVAVASKAAATAPQAKSSATAQSSSGTVIGILAMECQGQGIWWNSLPWAVVPVSNHVSAPADRECWERPISAMAPQHSNEPPDPPPRIVSG